MGILPSDLLRHAERLQLDALADAVPKEVYARAAVNRAYYSAFHTCRELQATLSIPSVAGGPPSVHAALIRDLRRYSSSKPESVVTVRSMGRLLKECRDFRGIADYQLDSSFPSERSEEAVAIAKQIHKLALNLVK